jgi:peptidoglycan L-alanyl-D-glutamate endopeptidase CwlK
MSFKFSKRSLKRMDKVHVDLQRVAHLALELSPYDFGIPQYGGYRSVDDQKKLFADGKSKADGEKSRSFHQYGNALDFYAYVDGRASWDEKYLAAIACAFLQAAMRLGVKIEWGGLWKSFKDMPHIQLSLRS